MAGYPDVNSKQKCCQLKKRFSLLRDCGTEFHRLGDIYLFLGVLKTVIRELEFCDGDLAWACLLLPLMAERKEREQALSRIFF